MSSYVKTPLLKKKKEIINMKSNKDNFHEVKRLPVYIYEAQLEKIDEICQKRKKSRRIVFFEAFQNYISLYKEGKL